MKRLFRVFSTLLCLSLLCSLYLNVSAVSNDSTSTYPINTPYEYPITPESEEWLEMSSHSERVNACQVPDSLLKNMSTSALIETISNYPLLVDVLLFDKADDAYQILYDGLNIVRELETRPNAAEELATFIATNEEIQGDYIRKTALEVILLSANFTASNTQNADILSSSQIDFTDAYTLYPELSPNFQFITAAMEARAATPKTPSGNPITVTWYYNRTPELTIDQISQIEETVYMNYGLYPARDATVKYNCHSYAWHDQSSSNKYWIDLPDDYLEDPLVDRTHTPTVDDRIVYQKNKNGEYLHSGIYIKSGSALRVASKWGNWGLYYHAVDNCPAEYGSYTSSYTIDS